MTKQKTVCYEPPPDGSERCCGNCFWGEDIPGHGYNCSHDPLPIGIEDSMVEFGGTCDYWRSLDA
ncbi:hypothetical protein LCGC14_2226600 [marine sediment metagenome]|uniref:Uncharacterized protein n=1 Tax=marine sediment metagenome TaxID=412755 RepID=A0A0F9DX32_9ZZZZ